MKAFILVVTMILSFAPLQVSCQDQENLYSAVDNDQDSKNFIWSIGLGYIQLTSNWWYTRRSPWTNSLITNLRGHRFKKTFITILGERDQVFKLGPNVKVNLGTGIQVGLVGNRYIGTDQIITEKSSLGIGLSGNLILEEASTKPPRTITPFGSVGLQYLLLPVKTPNESTLLPGYMDEAFTEQFLGLKVGIGGKLNGGTGKKIRVELNYYLGFSLNSLSQYYFLSTDGTEGFSISTFFQISSEE